MMKTLFLNPPSYEGFDGGAGSRYQARREVRSFWYPTWLAQAAALVPDSTLIDAPADELTLDDVLRRSGGYELVILHTSTPSVEQDAKTAASLKEALPGVRVGFVGAHTMVLPEETLRGAPAVDFVTTGEFDYAVRDIAAGADYADVRGIAYRAADGSITRTASQAPITDLDAFPYVTDVYQRHLTIEHYYIGYLQHPYVSLYTGRGCRSRCTFCLWPQTIAGHAYRTRSPEHVVAEMAHAQKLFPQVKEFFFDDDTFTDDRPRAEAIARGLGTLGLTWSCNAKANVPYETLKVLKDNGLRLLLVGFESGNQHILNNIKKGTRIDRAQQFMRDCHALGILVHGTFIVGLPGETRETIARTIEFAKEIDPYSLQVSLAAPYPGTELYAQAQTEGWLPVERGGLVAEGIQQAVLNYDQLSSAEMHEALERFYRAYYLRPRPILRIVRDMLRDREVMKRRLREAREFFSFMAQRRQPPAAAPARLADGAPAASH
ncbi:MAG TPA: hopanoid biosynthesis associated radical SAM protein HpnJ [Candidatus Dormibacteraeota bacterium]|nr:hopanoid biosynthesis associated radical SAM protein HpnJ [Candidatus Dormibacteraeota bacterium]